MAQQIRIELIVDDKGTPQIKAFNDELKQTPQAAGAAGQATEDLGNKTKTLREFVKEERSERKLQTFLFRESREAIGGVALGITLLSSSMEGASQNTKKLTQGVQEGFIAFQGFQFLMSSLGVTGPVGIAIAGVAALAIVFEKLSGAVDEATKSSIGKWLEELKKISNFKAGALLENTNELIGTLKTEIDTNLELVRSYDTFGGAGAKLVAKDKELAKAQQARMDILLEMKKALTDAAEKEKVFTEVLTIGHEVTKNIDVDNKQLAQSMGLVSYQTHIAAQQQKILNDALIALDDTMSKKKVGPEKEEPLPPEDKIFKEMEKNAERASTEYGKLLTDLSGMDTDYISEWVTKSKAGAEDALRNKVISEQEYNRLIDQIDKTARDKRVKDDIAGFHKIAQEGANALKQGIGIVSQFSVQNSQANIDRLETERDQKLANINAELAAEGLSEDQKKKLLAERAAVETDYNNRVKAEKTKAWEAEKEAKIAMVAIDVAHAIIVALSGAPPPFNAALAWITAGLAAAQMALIVAQPVPKFAQGGQFMVPSGYSNDSYPMMVQSGERVTVETPEQQGRSGGITIIINAVPIDTVQAVKKALQDGLKQTGLTIDRYAINNRSVMSLS